MDGFEFQYTDRCSHGNFSVICSKCDLKVFIVECTVQLLSTSMAEECKYFGEHSNKLMYKLSFYQNSFSLALCAQQFLKNRASTIFRVG